MAVNNLHVPLPSLHDGEESGGEASGHKVRLPGGERLGWLEIGLIPVALAAWMFFFGAGITVGTEPLRTEFLDARSFASIGASRLIGHGAIIFVCWTATNVGI